MKVKHRIVYVVDTSASFQKYVSVTLTETLSVFLRKYLTENVNSDYLI